jgi:hypothetical protein
LDGNGRTLIVRITVQCQPDQDPLLDTAPAVVVVRPGLLGTDDLQQLRRVLHALVTTAPRTVTVDLSDLDDGRRSNVVAVLVGAARDARTTGSTITVHKPPIDQRRALFVAGIDAAPMVEEATYEIVVGTLPVPADEPLAV